MTPFPPRSIAIAKTQDQDHAWRGRTLAACALFALAILGIGALNLDWSEGAAMALGQIAGMAAPIGVMGAVVWAAVAFTGRKS